MGENGGEAMNSLVGNIMTNGLGSLFASASSALPEAGELISHNSEALFHFRCSDYLVQKNRALDRLTVLLFGKS